MNKVMKKNDWLELANGLYNLGLSDTETIDNIVLRIAKELNIETNSVKIADLKKNVLTEIEVISQRGANADETNDDKFADGSLQEVEEVIAEEPIVEEPIVKEEPKIVYSELDNLRAECIMYGVGYNEKHKVSDLTQLLGQIRGRVSATMTLEDALIKLNPTASNEPASTMDANNFELTLDNADVVKEIAPAQSNTSVSIKLETKKIAIPVATIKNNLEVYRGTFTQTIRGHFRPQTIQEIRSLFSHQYPFTHEIKVNPKNEMQVEIIFSMNGVDVRVPSDDKNDWIEIR
jgi:hypothetical protein